MKKLRFLVSLTNNDNDYQIEQRMAAEGAAGELDIDVEIIHADNDSIRQTQQLLHVIQAKPDLRPHAIIFEPAGGTALPQVARAAVAAGIGWVALNCEADYISDLRQKHPVPVFSITSDHEEIGRIQGRQMAAILSRGGTALYVEGPSNSLPATQRTAGMRQTKPDNIELKILKAHWTEDSAYRSVRSWLRLCTSRNTPLDVIAAQDDSMAMGARGAIEELIGDSQSWLKLPFLGVDGLPSSGQSLVSKGLLTATIIVPTNTGRALKTLVQALRTKSLPNERILTVPRPYPTIAALLALKNPVTRSSSTQPSLSVHAVAGYRTN